MSTTRKFVYAALLAVTAVSFMPAGATAQESARGKFKLTHDVYWSSVTVPAGEYEFSYDANQAKPVLTLSKVDGRRVGFMLLVASAADSQRLGSNRLLLHTSPETSYVSTMELAGCGVTLYFNAPSHLVKPLAKTVATVASSGK